MAKLQRTFPGRVSITFDPDNRDESPYVDLDDAAMEYGVTESQMRDICRKGLLGHRIKPGWVITRVELEWFKRHIPKSVTQPKLSETRARQPL